MKQFDGTARSPDTQFQIGDHVIYLPEGVYTTIAGYVWHFANDGQPARIHAYRLACGCNAQENTITAVPKASIKHLSSEEVQRFKKRWHQYFSRRELEVVS